MPETTRQQSVETDFRSLLDRNALPPPDEVAHLERAVVFVWYEPKALVLVDLDELPPGASPCAGIDLDALEHDLCGAPVPFELMDFADTG